VCYHALSLLGGIVGLIELYQILFYLNMKRVMYNLKNRILRKKSITVILLSALNLRVGGKPITLFLATCNHPWPYKSQNTKVTCTLVIIL
jgi:hypothetical protein